MDIEWFRELQRAGQSSPILSAQQVKEFFKLVEHLPATLRITVFLLSALYETEIHLI